jgi:hypothetical protein
MTKTRITRVESWVNLGIPDCILALPDGLALAELKIGSSTGRVKLSPHQIAFHEAHRAHACFVLVEIGEGRKRTVAVYQAREVRALSVGEARPAGVFSCSVAGLSVLEGWLNSRVSTDFANQKNDVMI